MYTAIKVAEMPSFMFDLMLGSVVFMAFEVMDGGKPRMIRRALCTYRGKHITVNDDTSLSESNMDFDHWKIAVGIKRARRVAADAKSNK